MKNLLFYSFITPLIFILTGCGGTVSVKIPESQIISDKGKAHIVFVRPSNFTGTFDDANIYEFNTSDYQAKHIVKAPKGSKNIHSVKEGQYSFYTDARAFATPVIGNIITIDVEKGKVYYIDEFLRNYSNDRVKERIKVTKQLQIMDCSQKTLDKYLLEDFSEKDNGTNVSIHQSTNGESYIGNASLFKIKCSNNKITEVKDTYFWINPKEFKDLDLIKLEESQFGKVNNSVSKDIKNFYSIWENKFQNMPLPSNINQAFIGIKSIPNDRYYKKFDNVNFTLVSNKTKNKEIENEFDSLINKEINLNGNKTLNVKYSIEKFDEGSQAGRYMGDFVDSKKHSGVIHINVDFYDNNDNKISSVELSEIITHGVFGGISFLESNAANLLKKYINRNFIKE